MPDGADGLLPESLPSTPVPRVPVVADLPGKVLAVKEDETFLYSDIEGNLDDRVELGLGLYYRDTRFLSNYRLKISARDPILLSSSGERVYVSHVDLTNPDLYDEERDPVPQHTLNIRRIRAIKDRLYERIRVKNYNPFRIEIDVTLTFGADFADIFEVRGLSRQTRGTYEPPRSGDRWLEFGYHGEDEVRRRTRIEFGVIPQRVEIRGDLAEASFRVRLAGHETKTVSLTVEPIVGQSRAAPADFDEVVHGLRHSYEDWEHECTRIRTDNELFDQLLVRGLRDLRALYTKTDGGGIIAAGIPWYVAAFGRDTLITAHQMLMLSPGPARDSLQVLAEHQGTKVDDWRDEEPGKILHEIRKGELAGAGLLPHTPYFGSVDATPWFLILLAQYFRWTNDLGFVKEMLPAAEAALRWIDEYGDLDGDGFVEYRSRSSRGLRNHGWKDAHDSVMHADGSMAEPPIALAEVQAYVYMARTRMADVYSALEDYEQAVRLRDQATVLRRRFQEAFWVEEDGFFAGALDGDKRPVRTPVSNPGHGLYCGILEPGRAEVVARRLFEPDMFSGWGIRTMSKDAAGYNPMSYHNGTVWPHDNALIAAGLKRYGFLDQTNRVATAMFEAAQFADYLRLPELFCGFTRRTPSPPVQYPVACSPQAWAAGAPFLLLQAMLGISAAAHENVLTVNKPHMPTWLNEVEIRNLRVGDSTLSLVFRREGETTGFSLLSREGNVRVVMEE
ncbi:MAG TPA: amylo-alpha-1,6-glucosidase [Actinomycetota bacterium]|jgi:glycogen debranching enzyme|nr:amylo-alpha-1,6-glucosidase [Actinomycetota bacterium]